MCCVYEMFPNDLIAKMEQLHQRAVNSFDTGPNKKTKSSACDCAPFCKVDCLCVQRMYDGMEFETPAGKGSDLPNAVKPSNKAVALNT